MEHSTFHSFARFRHGIHRIRITAQKRLFHIDNPSRTSLCKGRLTVIPVNRGKYSASRAQCQIYLKPAVRRPFSRPGQRPGPIRQKKLHKTTPPETATLIECLVPACGISIAPSHRSTAACPTPITSLPKTSAYFTPGAQHRVGMEKTEGRPDRLRHDQMGRETRKQPLSG